MKIKEMPVDSQPRVKFLKHGPEFLTDSELLAILLRTGTIASLVAPWSKWGVDKRREKLRWRKGFIQECKRVMKKRNFDLDRFKKSHLYSSLKPNLSPELRKFIILKDKKYIPGKRRPLEEDLKIIKQESKLNSYLLDEITSLERKWGLL